MSTPPVPFDNYPISSHSPGNFLYIESQDHFPGLSCPTNENAATPPPELPFHHSNSCEAVPTASISRHQISTEPYDLLLGGDATLDFRTRSAVTAATEHAAIMDLSPFTPSSPTTIGSLFTPAGPPTTAATTGQWPLRNQPSIHEEDLKRDAVVSDKIRALAGKRREKKATFLCPFAPKCNATFTAQHNLRYHMNAHMGLKPYKCKQCGHTTASPATLRRHEKNCVASEVQLRQERDEGQYYSQSTSIEDGQEVAVETQDGQEWGGTQDRSQPTSIGDAQDTTIELLLFLIIIIAAIQAAS